MDKKRIIFTIIFIIVSIIFGYLLYRVFFAPKEVPPAIIPGEEVGVGKLPIAEEGKITPGVTGPPGVLPEAEKIQPVTEAVVKQYPSYPIKKIVESSLIDPKIKSDGTANFYNTSDGKFYHLGADGKVKVMSDEVFYNVEKVTWSPIKDESIIEYPDGSNIYYNFENQKKVTLPKHWEDFSFSTLGDKIASKSIGMSPENRWLITSDPDGKSISLVEPMGENADRVTIDWSPNKQVVALSRTGEALGADREEILFVGLHGENFRSMIVEGRDFKEKWSPTGQKMLYSVYSIRSNFQPELWIVNSSGENIGTGRKLLGLSTWADKCVFKDDRFVYCAVPTDLKMGAGLAPGLMDYSEDEIYKIDTQTGLKSIIPLEEYHTIDSLFIDGKNNLIFTDKNQNGLFTLPL
ncbi:hypothetical protein KJ785_01525 [Patescibacteria group bacterium]|nr:hypothetical protein [Patescibacteria group bacterium]